MAGTTLLCPGSPCIDLEGETARWQRRADECGAATRIVGIGRDGELALDVAARAVATVDGPFSVLGVSGGTPSALAIAATAAERVERLAVVSGFPHPMHGLGILEPLAAADAPSFRTLCELVFASQPDDLDALVDELRRDLVHLRQPWPFDVTTIDVPTTIFHAADDQSCPVTGARWLAGQISGARYVEWPDGGHGASADHLAEIFAVL